MAHLANIRLRRNEHHQASQLYEEVLAISREMKDRAMPGAALTNLGGILNHQGHPQQALASFDEAAQVYRMQGNEWGLLYSFQGLGRTRESPGDTKQTLQMYQASAEIRRKIGEPMPGKPMPGTAEEYGVNQQRVRAQHERSRRLALPRPMRYGTILLFTCAHRKAM